MTSCSHTSCNKDKRIWLPEGSYTRSDVKLHPWCINCGTVKNISDDRGHKLGYWMNVLSNIANRFSLKQVQKRCIAKDLLAHEHFNDDSKVRHTSVISKCSIKHRIDY